MTMDDAVPDASAAPQQPTYTIARWARVDGGFGSDDDARYTAARTWRQEMPRWLASLNPGRTQQEYEKAVRYFFETPGVPQDLENLSFDLLLAYRGALAQRATSRERGTPQSRRAYGPARQSTEMREALASGATSDLTAQIRASALASLKSDPETEAHGKQAEPKPLAPATVNIRLTALRQFLAHCVLMGSLPQLSVERIHAALRRLHIERRRPYQVLAEPEWEQFLQAARAPAGHSAAGAGIAREERSPWGTPHALRRTQMRAAAGGDTDGKRGSVSRYARSRAGLTGERTALRDHALIALALATGLRSIELASLDVGDLVREWHAGQEEWWLVLPDAKTKGQHGGRTLPLAPPLVETLLSYIRATGRQWERPSDQRTPLFLSMLRRARVSAPAGQSGQAQQQYYRLSATHIRSIVDRVETQWLAQRQGGYGDVSDESGDDRKGRALAGGETRAISPHALRHSTAIALLEGNTVTGRPPASVEHVRGWLGHFDIRTTQGYLAHLESRRHRRPFALSPLPPQSPPGQGEARQEGAYEEMLGKDSMDKGIL